MGTRICVKFCVKSFLKNSVLRCKMERFFEKENPEKHAIPYLPGFSTFF